MAAAAAGRGRTAMASSKPGPGRRAAVAAGAAGGPAGPRGRRGLLAGGAGLALLTPAALFATQLAHGGVAQAQEALGPPPEGLEVATFAGGCFWCMEPPFDKVEGVLSTTSGYSGGDEASPSYNQVSAGVTGHSEAMQVLFDPAKVSYGELLTVYWHQIDPTVKNRQFCDSGRQYRSAIYYHSEAQKEEALASFKRYQDSGAFGTKKFYTEVEPAKAFWPAEEYHQDYYKKNPILYKYYRFNCGRDKYLQKIWGDAAPKEEV